LSSAIRVGPRRRRGEMANEFHHCWRCAAPVPRGEWTCWKCREKQGLKARLWDIYFVADKYTGMLDSP
jgi:hypothetical protein